MNKPQQTTYRQGDVLLIAVDQIPTGAKPAPLENGKIILAHGEVTGHHHAVMSSPTALGFMVKDDLYLNIKKPTHLTHQEHGPITLPKGKYKSIRQVEYQRKELRRVAD